MVILTLPSTVERVWYKGLSDGIKVHYFRASILHNMTDTDSMYDIIAQISRSGNIVKQCLFIYGNIT